ncbi:MAG: hypothetical protein R2716_10830 [Microthrixaceae bacterium]
MGTDHQDPTAESPAGAVENPGSTGSEAGDPDARESGFRCPRCGEDATEAFYGPCSRCRAALRATVRADPGEVEAAAYEPKMNVTPNAVALKE